MHSFSLTYGVILPSSLATVLSLTSGFSPCPPVSVLVRATLILSLEAFLGSWSHMLHYLTMSFAYLSRFASCARIFLSHLLFRFAHNPFSGSYYPSSSLLHYKSGYRNIYLFSIDYAFRPRLRSRLTQGGRTFPWNPWAIGV